MFVKPIIVPNKGVDENENQLVKTLGGNIRRERVAKKITQEKLAEHALLSARTIQKIEAGDFVVLYTTLVRIQRALKCDWSKLMP